MDRSSQMATNEEIDAREDPPFNPFIFLPPALCDMTATSIQYIGLTLTFASSFQMLRGMYALEHIRNCHTTGMFLK